jgi:hypothetical protein
MLVPLPVPEPGMAPVVPGTLSDSGVTEGLVVGVAGASPFVGVALTANGSTLDADEDAPVDAGVVSSIIFTSLTFACAPPPSRPAVTAANSRFAEPE